MNRLCPACGATAAASTDACPKCGQSFWVSSDPLNGSRSNNAAGIVGVVLGLALPLFGVLFLLSRCGGEVEKSPDEIRSEAQEIAENRDRGLHCLSGWDGSLPALNEAVKNQLRDPDSFEHVDTIISPKGSDDRHDIMMKYRARNGFGGLNVEHVKGTVSNVDCSVRIDQMGL
jgi:hypothetical protein